MVFIPNTQVIASETFRIPPTLAHDSLAIPEIYDWHAKNSPEHPLFVYADGKGEIKTIVWLEAVRAIHRAAYRVSSVVKVNASPGNSTVIAVLAASDTATYFCFLVGMLRAGFTVFPISPRNNPPAIAHLLKKTSTTRLFVSQEPVIQSLASASIELFKKDGDGQSITVYETPIFEDLFLASGSEASFEWFPSQHFNMEAPALILHSSGSTAFPKPVTWDHRGLLVLAKVPFWGEIDFCGSVMGCHSLPMFHGLGALQICIAASTGVIMSVFKPAAPATIPTPINVLEGAMATQSDFVCCVPAFIEAWSQKPESVEYIKSIKGIMYGGGPLNKERGNFLASQGVNIYVTYACTEGGPLSTFLRSNPGMDWEYFSFSGHTRPELLPYSGDIFEVAMTKHAMHIPRILNDTIAGEDVYMTNDLVVPHPTEPSLWKVYGRADDQIMLSTGEKTNPGPLETIICQDPHIQAAVFFGRGRFQNGAVIEPKKEFAFDPRDEVRLTDFRNAIWPTAERLNSYAPTHSRLFKEMILIASPSKPFTYTAKGTARRQAIIADYAEEIDTLYKAVAETTQSDIGAPDVWDLTHTLAFLRQSVTRVLAKDVGDEDDIFQYGCDSLQATWVRNSLLRALRDSDAVNVIKTLPENLIYQYPSISSLASFISSAVLKPADARDDDYREADKLQEMLGMLENYSAAFPARLVNSTEINDAPKGDVVLLTGSTGGFGCNLLAQLVYSNDVAKIFALNRASPQGTSLQKRQVDALKLHGIDIDVVLNSKVVLVESDLRLPGLGVEATLLEEIRNSTTHIIHNAWRVDFNLALTSFEGNIQGLRNLINLSLSSPHHNPPRLVFVSSIGVFRHPTRKGMMPEQPITDPKVALGGGYTESKWISEAILGRAARQTHLRPLIVRVGQLTGDKSGNWNEREWFPSMVKSAVTLKCIPDVDAFISWMPSYDAAAALIEMRNAPECHSVLHLVHPRPVSWTSLISPIAKALDARQVSYEEWLKSLEQVVSDRSISDVEHMRRNPALRLLDFFRHVEMDAEREPPGAARLDTSVAVQVSNALKSTMKSLGEADALKWVDNWRMIGYL